MWWKNLEETFKKKVTIKKKDGLIWKWFWRIYKFSKKKKQVAHSEDDIFTHNFDTNYLFSLPHVHHNKPQKYTQNTSFLLKSFSHMAGEEGVHAIKHLLFAPSVIAEGMILMNDCAWMHKLNEGLGLWFSLLCWERVKSVFFMLIFVNI